MAPPNNPNVVKIALIFSRDTRTMVNTLHFHKTGAAVVFSDMVTLASEIQNWFNTVYKLALPSAVALTQIQVRKFDPADPLAYDLNVSPPIAGTRAGLAEAGSVTATVSERTGFAGRKFRGRFYVPAVSESDVGTSDLLASALQVLLANVGSALVGTLWSNSMHPAIFHLATNLFNEVISTVVSFLVDSQRRRLPGRGR